MSNTKRITFTTIATATVRERWVLEVPAELEGEALEHYAEAIVLERPDRLGVVAEDEVLGDWRDRELEGELEGIASAPEVAV